MKFIKGTYYLLPSQRDMVECKVYSVRLDKDKVTFEVENTAKSSWTMPDELQFVKFYLEQHNIEHSFDIGYNVVQIICRASLICHHIKPLGEAYNLIYAD